MPAPPLERRCRSTTLERRSDASQLARQASIAERVAWAIRSSRSSAPVRLSPTRGRSVGSVATLVPSCPIWHRTARSGSRTSVAPASSTVTAATNPSRLCIVRLGARPLRRPQRPGAGARGPRRPRANQSTASPEIPSSASTRRAPQGAQVLHDLVADDAHVATDAQRTEPDRSEEGHAPDAAPCPCPPVPSPNVPAVPRPRAALRCLPCRRLLALKLRPMRMGQHGGIGRTRMSASRVSGS